MNNQYGFQIFTSRFLFQKTKWIINMVLLIIISTCATAQVSFETDALKLTIDNSGKVVEITNKKSNTNYLSADTVTYFIAIVTNEVIHHPIAAKFNSQSNTINFSFENSDAQVEVKCTKKKTYLAFEVVKATPTNLVDAISWGSIYTNISKLIGEAVGVVRNEKVAIGMLVLNEKTLGGLYNKNSMSDYRGSLALSYKLGSSLQAYSINRDRNRKADAMSLKDIPLKAIKGETVNGSKIALFSCDEANALNVIEQIVLDEKLPHPTNSGIWAKKAFLNSRSYLISDFKESNMDTVIDYAKRGGFFSVYHEGPFATWGHFDLDTAYFPDGKSGIKKCAAKAKAAGLYFGVHTLTNFITTNDAYITPVPDERLAFTGYGFLSEAIDSSTKTITVSTKEFFKDTLNNNLHTVKIGKELIRYKSVTATAPYQLTECVRGAFGTKANAHLKNDTVKKQIDHAYMVFFPNLEMQKEIAVYLATFFNECGISHLDFDGYEGCFATGEGDYATNLFAKDFFKTIDHEMVIGTSMSRPYFWYINTLCNWGEPWYGGFNQSMQEYRIKNQDLLERNYFPNMLGWYMLTKNTTANEMEWMLARSAGYNAGFAMVARMQAVKQNPNGLALLEIIKQWETARLSNAFSEEQRARLKNPDTEFHLEKVKEKEWNLYQFEKTKPFLYEKTDKQPGEPTASRFDFDMNSFNQKLQFKIEVKGDTGSVKNIKLTLDNYTDILIPNELLAGETLLCEGTDTLRIYSKIGKQKSVVLLPNKISQLTMGKHQLLIDAQFIGEETPKIETIIMWMRKGEIVVGK